MIDEPRSAGGNLRRYGRAPGSIKARLRRLEQLTGAPSGLTKGRAVFLKQGEPDPPAARPGELLVIVRAIAGVGQDGQPAPMPADLIFKPGAEPDRGANNGTAKNDQPGDG